MAHPRKGVGLFIGDSSLLHRGPHSNTVSMSSPITGSDWVVATPGQSFCDRMTNLLSMASKLRLWFDWAFDSSGKATDDFKSMFLLPPGVIMPYYANGSEEAIKAAVLTLNGGSTANPFWRLCDGTNGTPDLRGRTIVGAGQGSGLTNRIIGATFGDETQILTEAQMPPHSHQPSATEMTGKKVTLHPGYSTQEAGGDSNLSYSFNGTPPTFVPYSDFFVSVGGGEAHGNMQPSMAVWYIMRTTRTE